MVHRGVPGAVPLLPGPLQVHQELHEHHRPAGHPAVLPLAPGGPAPVREAGGPGPQDTQDHESLQNGSSMETNFIAEKLIVEFIVESTLASTY